MKGQAHALVSGMVTGHCGGLSVASHSLVVADYQALAAQRLGAGRHRERQPPRTRHAKLEAGTRLRRNGPVQFHGRRAFLPNRRNGAGCRFVSPDIHRESAVYFRTVDGQFLVQRIGDVQTDGMSVSARCPFGADDRRGPATGDHLRVEPCAEAPAHSHQGQHDKRPFRSDFHGARFRIGAPASSSFVTGAAA